MIERFRPTTTADNSIIQVIQWLNILVIDLKIPLKKCLVNLDYQGIVAINLNYTIFWFCVESRLSSLFLPVIYLFTSCIHPIYIYSYRVHF